MKLTRKHEIDAAAAVTEQHVALMMDWLKTARLLNDLSKADSWIDKCGYSALGAEFSDRKTKL